ncbi:MAG: polyphosphate kinase 2 family protein [Chitinivibrionales bacterium]|nr:polyphosphate kinase 2 family protein [Chitinivibrionales bacterium]
MDTNAYRIAPGTRPSLAQLPTAGGEGMQKAEGRTMLRELHRELQELQQTLYASRTHAVLIVLQAMDAAGKDSTIRRCFGPLNPQGCRVVTFRQPTDVELRHDFLWRIHKQAPQHGEIGIFNRSHYESILVERVKELTPLSRVEPRYDHINNFERMLTDEKTVIVKFYLHVSKQYQRQRFERRLRRDDKRWKFNPTDLDDRASWKQYMEAYEWAFARCSTEYAPWYVVPAERRWFRDVVITQVVVESLRRLDLDWPQPPYDPSTVHIPA